VQLGVVILPEQRWPVARSLWQQAESLGFDHAWTYDHLAWRSLRDGPWFTAMPVLVAAATATTSIRLGTLVASPNFRHPAVFAKELVALDDVSGGRAIGGVGAGGTGWDAEMLGVPALSRGRRGARFAEFVKALDLLLREQAATFRGEHFVVQEGRTLPGSVQQPRLPLAVAATGPRGMRVAAAFGDYWVTTGDPAEQPGSRRRTVRGSSPGSCRDWTRPVPTSGGIGRRSAGSC
jgi:alkanesulfonate monooxygenase SsuD/methylene tetrahydromethanopterin reductase-like flavin-dependent oxidoreductase (luciferase family)